jgi:hypothetical protein
MRGLRRKKVSKGARMRIPLPPPPAVEDPARAVRPSRWMYCSGLAGRPTWRTVVTLATRRRKVSTKVGKEEERGKRTEIHSTSSNVRSKHDTANSVLERLGSRIPLTLTLARVNLVEIDALVPEAGRALEKVGDKAGSPRRREEDHDLERRKRSKREGTVTANC